MKSILHVKRHLTWLKVYLVIISARELKVNKQKKNSRHLVPKAFDFSHNSSVPFHWVTFGHSISCVLLIDKPNESSQNSKKFERNVISTTKKAFKKKRKDIRKDKCPHFTNFFRTAKINNSKLSNEKQRTYKWSLDNFKRKYQDHLCPLVLI